MIYHALTAQKSFFYCYHKKTQLSIAQYVNMDIVNDLISLGIFDKKTGELYGTVGAGKHDDLHEPEIFYELLPEHIGYGYATEAVNAVTK